MIKLRQLLDGSGSVSDGGVGSAADGDTENYSTTPLTGDSDFSLVDHVADAEYAFLKLLDAELEKQEQKATDSKEEEVHSGQHGDNNMSSNGEEKGGPNERAAPEESSALDGPSAQ